MSIDLRKRVLEGQLSDKVDIDDAYRTLCSHFKQPLTKMKAFTDSQQGINENGLMKLCNHLGVKFECDSLYDTFSVTFNDKSTDLIAVKGFAEPKKEEAPPVIKSDDDLKENEDPDEEDLF